MKSKIVLWGKDSNDAKNLIALKLTPDENKVDVWIFPEPLATEEFSKQLLFEWKEGKDIAFPEGFLKHEAPLTISGDLIPEGITVDKPEILQRAQTEWHFMVLSSKLNAAYQGELDELEERIGNIEAYSQQEWDNLKAFWGKVREQMHERNLFKEHASALKERTNSLFDKLKGLRSSLDAEFKAQAQETYNRFVEKLNDIEDRVAKNINLYNVFEELKELQIEFRNAKLTRDLRNEVWKRIDGTFKKVKEKRFGTSNNNPVSRLERRYDGLLEAIKKMENSIRRDQNELDFQNKKINSAYTGQLETQIRQAKLKMIDERIDSKRKKLEEMYKTKVELEDKIENAKARQAADDAKKADDAEKRAAKEKAKEKAKEATEKAAEQVEEKEETPEEQPAEAPKEAAAEKEPEQPKEEVAEAPAEEPKAEEETTTEMADEGEEKEEEEK